MTYIEVLPTLRTLNRKDKIRAIQFLATEIAHDEGVYFENRVHEFVSQTDAYSASRELEKLLREHNDDAVS